MLSCGSGTLTTPQEEHRNSNVRKKVQDGGCLANYNTLTDLLIDQTERKLRRLETSITRELERLGGELKIVQAALARKARERESSRATRRKPTNGDGLSRADLLTHVVAMD